MFLSSTEPSIPDIDQEQELDETAEDGASGGNLSPGKCQILPLFSKQCILKILALPHSHFVFIGYFLVQPGAELLISQDQTWNL